MRPTSGRSAARPRAGSDSLIKPLSLNLAAPLRALRGRKSSHALAATLRFATASSALTAIELLIAKAFAQALHHDSMTHDAALEHRSLPSVHAVAPIFPNPAALAQITFPARIARAALTGIRRRRLLSFRRARLARLLLESQLLLRERPTLPAGFTRTV